MTPAAKPDSAALVAWLRKLAIEPGLGPLNQAADLVEQYERQREELRERIESAKTAQRRMTQNDHLNRDRYLGILEGLAVVERIMQFDTPAKGER